MTTLHALRGLAARSPFCIDRDGNVACHWCGTYLNHVSRDGQLSAGQHRATCEWMMAQAVIALETEGSP